jgi:cytoskeletal protein RodZ
MKFAPKHTINLVIGITTISTLSIASWLGGQFTPVAEAQSTSTPSKPAPTSKPSNKPAEPAKPKQTGQTTQPEKKPATSTPSSTTPSNKSGIPEETQIQLVTQFSDQVAARLQKATCPEVATLLDEVKAAGNKPQDPNSLVGRLLDDMKNNPKLKSIVIQKLSEPMMTRLLECNMVPINWIQSGK